MIVVSNQDCERFSAIRARQRDHRALFDLWLAIERGFEIRGKDLQTSGSDDRVLAAAAKVNVAVCIDFADVAGVNPALLIGECLSQMVPVTRRDVVAAHEDLAVVTQLHLLACNGLADRTMLHAKRMRQARQRCRLSHAVALDDCVTNASPKSFRVTLQGGATRDESPQAPAEATMHVTEGPPIAQETSSLGSHELLFDLRAFARNLFLQRLEHTRHRHHDIDSLLLHYANDLRRLVRLTKINLRTHELGNEDAHQLSEHVTQRQQAKKPQRMYQPFPASILAKLFFDRCEVREQIAMSQTNAFRLGGRA